MVFHGSAGLGKFQPGAPRIVKETNGHSRFVTDSRGSVILVRDRRAGVKHG